MYTIRVETIIAAPQDRCFDLARSVDAHVQSTANTGERIVGGRMSGLMVLGEEVTWEARHFGVKQRLTSRITQFDRPNSFQDRMVRGAFAEFEHDHLFEAGPEGTTTMVDILRFRAPLGPLGWIAERILLSRYLTRFLQERGLALKVLAESGDWAHYCSQE